MPIEEPGSTAADMPPARQVGAWLASAGEDAEDVLRAVARMSPLAMVLTDPNARDCPLVFSNRAFTQLTGYSEQESRGRNLRFLQGEQTDEASRRLLRDAIAAGQEVQVELWNYRKDGSPFWCSMFVGPVFDRTGKLAYWFGSQLDASARREVDEARAHASRMDTLGSMAAGISHEFNNLMTVVVANAEGVRADPLTPRQAERLGRVEWGARAAGHLTQQMLSFAGRSSLRAGIVDLNVVVRGFDRLLAQLAAPGSRLELDLVQGSLPAEVDVGQLELSLINLVRNASDASAPGTVIVVSTRRTLRGGNPEVEVAVTDEGSGMAPHVVARATEPFFTTKAHGQGTGLGLAMVAGFVRQSGGRVDIESARGAGTTVRLAFPGAGAA